MSNIQLSSPHHFSSDHSHFCRSRSCPRGSSSQQERTEHRGREQIELEIDRVCHGQTTPPWSQRLRRCFWSAQICCRRSLLYPGKLRGATIFRVLCPERLQMFQRMEANKQAIDSLAPRVKALSASLCTPVSEDDFKEQERRKQLEQ